MNSLTMHFVAPMGVGAALLAGELAARRDLLQRIIGPRHTGRPVDHNVYAPRSWLPAAPISPRDLLIHRIVVWERDYALRDPSRISRRNTSKATWAAS
jgi:hypothetical protein